MAPKPVATSRPIDIVPARRRPMVSVAVAVAEQGTSRYRYSARGGEQRWTGTLDAENRDSALLDVITRIRTDSDVERIRFVVQLSPRSMLWAMRDEIALLIPGVWIERPRLSDETLIRQACMGLREVAPVSAAPVWVATDGSVRGRITGYGWLASSGEYGLQGFRYSTKLIGPKVVLVAELRAIGSAVQKLRGRDITVLSDSKLAIAMANRWMAGHDVLPDGYATYRESGRTPGLVRARELIYQERDRLNLV